MSPAVVRTSRVAALIALAACGTNTDAGTGAGTGLDGPDRRIDWTREAVYTLGGAEAEGWSAFGDVSAVGFDGTGNLYILDSQAKQVYVVGPDGSLIRSMGTPGEGPGEFGAVRDMTVFADGTVAVFDLTRFSLIVYGPDGEWIRDVRIDPSETGLLSSPMLPLPYHTVAARVGGRIRMGPPAAGAEDEEEERGRPVIGVPLDEEAGGASNILVGWEPPPPGGEGEETSMRTEGGGAIMLRMNRLRAFTPDLRLAVMRDGRILVADSTTYRISVHAPDGTPSEEVGRPIAPVAVTTSIEEKERERRLTELESSPNGGARVMVLGGSGGGSVQAPDLSEMMKNQIDGMVFYPEIQVIERLAADWADRIWVQRTSADPGEPGPTDVITLDREYLGTLPADGLRIPRAFGPDGLGVWIEQDEFDADRVVVARIRSDG